MNLYATAGYPPRAGDWALPIIFCDAVINSGNSIKELLETLAPLHPGRLVVVCMTMQAAAKSLAVQFPLVPFFAMRVSENKFTGRRGTDTGNRLFNTMQLE